MTVKVDLHMQSSPIARQAETRLGRRRPPWLRRGLLWFAFDLLAPTALLYVLLWLGSGLYLALLASAFVSAVSALVSYQRGAGNRRFAPYMLALSVVGLAIALVTGRGHFCT